MGQRRDGAHIEALIALGVDGIEVIHPTANAADETRLRAIAAEHDLIITGGTDFHAPVERRPIGIELLQSHLLALAAV